MGILLWPQGQAAPAAGLLNPHTAEDLQLDRIAGAMIFNNYYKLTTQELFKLWTSDPQVITYRQNVLRDILEHPQLETLLDGLLDSIDTWESHSSRGNRAENPGAGALDLWDFSFLDAFLQKIASLEETLQQIPLASEGMIAFRDRVHKMATSQRFTAVRDAYMQRCGGSTLPSRITIGFNLNENLKPVTLKLMAIPETAKKGRRMSLTPTAVQMTHQILARAISEAGRSISGFVRMESGELRLLKQDIIFYLSALHLKKSWDALGLKSCLPEIRPLGTQVFDTKDMFSPLLALHENGHIVTNDIALDPQGELLILTGANQGGKTVFLHSVALTQWLSQLGIMVPCREASISPASQVLTVFAPTVLSSSAGKGMGLLSEEAGRIADAAAHLTENSMVLFNEPLNATSPMENLYISQEVLGAFKAAGARGVWVTHLYELASDRHRVNQLIPWGSRLGSAKILVETDESGIHSTYHIARGEPEFKSYAAEVMRRKGI